MSGLITGAQGAEMRPGLSVVENAEKVALMFDSEGDGNEEVKQGDRGFGDLASAAAAFNQPQIARDENQNQEDTTPKGSVTTGAQPQATEMSNVAANSGQPQHPRGKKSQFS
jgi:hypothetical protein